MKTDEQTVAAPEVATVRAQLARITSSSPFIRSNRIGNFLTFVVEATLAGDMESLKETFIGASVFGRSLDYDPKIDPIVRVEARRLRSKLQEFYEDEGLHDALLITLPKGGYRPIFELREPVVDPPAPRMEDASTRLEEVDAVEVPNLAQAPQPLETPGKTTVPGAWRPNRALWLSGLALLNLAILGAFVAWLLNGHKPAPDDARTVPLTSYVGQEFDPAISPDGHHLAFVWDGDAANYDIYVKSIPRGEPVRLTTDPAHDLHPAWSPDGRDLAFLRVTPAGSAVFIEPSSGGPERKLGDINNVVSLWKADASQMIGSLGPSWSPDGRAVVVDDGGSLFMWPLAYENRRQLTRAPSGNNDFYPRISPDGSKLAFVRQTSNSSGDLYLVKLADPLDTAPRRLTTDRADIRGVTWSADSRSLIFASNRVGGFALWKLTVEDAQDRLESVTTNSTQATDPTLSRESELLAFTESTQNTNIWRMALPAVGQPAGERPERIIASSRRNNSGQYSPDGRKIAFVSDRSGSWEIWVADADGRSPRQLTSFHGPLVGTPHWSPDGRQIAFDARPSGHSAIFLIDSSGGSPRLLNQNNFEERMPTWSADARFLYFNSTRSGTVRLWRMKLPSFALDATPLTDRPAYDLFEADGGKTLYFRSNGPGLWSVPATGGPATPVQALSSVEPSRYLAASPRALYFVDREDAPRHLDAYSFATHKVTQLAQIEGAIVSGTPSLSVSPDEHFVIYAQQDESGSDILGVPKPKD